MGRRNHVVWSVKRLGRQSYRLVPTVNVYRRTFVVIRCCALCLEPASPWYGSGDGGDGQVVDPDHDYDRYDDDDDHDHDHDKTDTTPAGKTQLHSFWYVVNLLYNMLYIGSQTNEQQIECLQKIHTKSPCQIKDRQQIHSSVSRTVGIGPHSDLVG